uniref:SH3 domain-containing protein n=1 Tax=Cairina moschata TaxID=8855 RepID=A0A8C3CZW1_CAIMO
MESVALYNFQATEKDELPFRKGDTLKVRGFGGWEGKERVRRVTPVLCPKSARGCGWGAGAWAGGRRWVLGERAGLGGTWPPVGWGWVMLGAKTQRLSAPRWF